MEKLFLMTEYEIGRKVLYGNLNLEIGKWAILFSKYLRTYFNK